MNCFICKKIFSDLKILTTHLKLFHNLKTHSIFHCCFENCTQQFPNIDSFRKHARKHIDDLAKFNNDSKSLDNNLQIANNPQNSLGSINIHNAIRSNKTELPQIALLNSHNCAMEVPTNFRFNKCLDEMFKSVVEFVLNFHNFDNFAIKNVLDIQNGVISNIIQPIINTLLLFVEMNLKQHSCYTELRNFLNECSNPFVYCSSNYRLRNWLLSHDYLQNPKQFNINNEISEVFYNGVIIYDENITKGVLLPLKFQFRKVFEKNDEILNTLSRIELWSRENTNLINFTQGLLWKEKIKYYKDRITVPFFLFIDDLEVNNPLGSNSARQSVANIYYCFPCCENNSKLNKIYLAAIIKSVDMKQFGNDNSLITLVTELKDLEEKGIDIRTNQGVKHVHFILGLVLGDNLGLNSILNINTSFNSINYCRFCRDPKSITQRLCEENHLSLRNIENYEEDVTNLRAGIQQNSILNNIATFHVTTNYTVDVMHDIYEGICHYDMCHIITYFTKTMKYFTLPILNSRKELFSYGTIEVGNISAEIKKEHLKNFHLKMNAREVMNFVHFFPLLVGDLVPNDDEVWLFLINLLEIIDIILCYKIPLSYINLLRIKIKQHNSDYIRLFSDTLKPKHHFLIHYPTVITNSGPPRNYWSFRFEAKHKQFKIYASSITSRRNICLTLAKKFQYKFAYDLITNKHRSYSMKSNHKIQSSQIEFISNQLQSRNFDCYTEIENLGTTYKQCSYLSIYSDGLHIYEISEIIMSNNSGSIYILCAEIQVNGFDPHFAAYCVEPNNKIKDNFLIDITKFSGPPVNINKVSTGHYMVRLKEHF